MSRGKHLWHGQPQSKKEIEVYRTEKGRSLEAKGRRNNLWLKKLARNKII